MMFDKLFLIAAGVFFLLFGLDVVTNAEILWMREITGFAALVAGVIAVIRAFR